MAIIKLYDKDGREREEEEEEEETLETYDYSDVEYEFEEGKGGIFKKIYTVLISFLVVRLFIVMVSFFCVLFFFYSLIQLLIGGTLRVLSFSQVPFFIEMQRKHWSNVKLSLVCIMGLIVAMFSPSLGVTILTAYFMMSMDSNNNVLFRFLEQRLKEFEKGDR